MKVLKHITVAGGSKGVSQFSFVGLFQYFRQKKKICFCLLSLSNFWYLLIIIIHGSASLEFMS